MVGLGFHHYTLWIILHNLKEEKEILNFLMNAFRTGGVQYSEKVVYRERKIAPLKFIIFTKKLNCEISF